MIEEYINKIYGDTTGRTLTIYANGHYGHLVLHTILIHLKTVSANITVQDLIEGLYSNAPKIGKVC